jgi:hypothetical protein
LKTAQESYDEFLMLIDNYLDISHSKFSSFKDEYLVVSNFNVEDIHKTSREHLLANAYLLHGYASYIQDEFNRNSVVLKWCDAQLDMLVVKHEKEFGFPQYTKHESKKTILISENSYAEKINELRFAAETRLHLLDGKVFQIKKLGDILMEKSKI